MFFYLVFFLLPFLTLLIALVFSILAYHHQKQQLFFYLGLSFTVLSVILLATSYNKFVLTSSIGWFLIAIVATCIILLILTKSKTNEINNNIVDATSSGQDTRPTLDDIINGPDEDWDPESTIERYD